MAVKPIPDGYHSLTPYIVAKDVAKTIAFLKAAFGATELFPPLTTPDGTIKHAEVKIGDSVVMFCEAQQDCPAKACMLYHYVADVDAVYKRAIQAGGKSIREPEDQFYGDRSGGVIDPSGNEWWIGTHKEDLSGEEIARRAAEYHKQKSPV